MGEPRPRGPLRPQPPWVPAVPGRAPQPIVPLMPRISLLRVHLNSAEPVLQSRGNIPRAKEPENRWGKSTSAQGTPVQAAQGCGEGAVGGPWESPGAGGALGHAGRALEPVTAKGWRLCRLHSPAPALHGDVLAGWADPGMARHRRSVPRTVPGRSCPALPATSCYTG